MKQFIPISPAAKDPACFKGVTCIGSGSRSLARLTPPPYSFAVLSFRAFFLICDMNPQWNDGKLTLRLKNEVLSAR